VACYANGVGIVTEHQLELRFMITGLFLVRTSVKVNDIGGMDSMTKEAREQSNEYQSKSNTGNGSGIWSDYLTDR
jgi:hypothetical protein